MELQIQKRASRLVGIRGDCLLQMESTCCTRQLDVIPQELWTGVPLPSCKQNVSGSVAEHR